MKRSIVVLMAILALAGSLGLVGCTKKSGMMQNDDGNSRTYAYNR